MEIKKKVVKATMINFLGSVFVRLVEFLRRIILARILLPSDFGIVAFSRTIPGFLQNFTDLRFSFKVIQDKDENRKTYLVNTAFTFQLFLSLFFLILLFFFSPFIANFLEKKGIVNFLRLFSLLFFFQALMVPGSLLQKELEFLKLNIVSLISTIIGFLVAVIMAFKGFGAWSIAGGIVLGEFSRVVLLWFFLPFRPKIYFDKKIFKEIINFSFPLYLLAILVWLFWNGDDFLVGYLLGNKELGFYTIAFYIPHQFLFIQQLITRVSFPAFSKVQDEKEKILRGFELLTKYSAIFIFSIAGVLIPFARPTIIYIFGEKWIPATTSFILFLILVIQRSIFGHWSNLYLALGKTKTLLFSYIPIPFLLFTFGPYFSLKYGIEGMAGTVVLIVVLFTPLVIYFVRKIIPVNFLKILFKPLLVFILVFFVSLKIKTFVNSFSIYVFSVTGLFLLYYLLLFFLDRNLIKEIKYLFFEKDV